MPEIGTSGSMSGDGRRGAGHRPQAIAPILDSTSSSVRLDASMSATQGTSTVDGVAMLVIEYRA